MTGTGCYPRGTSEARIDPPSTCAAPHLDGCPECVVNVEEPRTHTNTDTGCRCAYTCADCGHRWTTDYRSG